MMVLQGFYSEYIKHRQETGGCGVNRMDGESNENVYRKCGMSSRGMSCGVVEMVKCNTLRWFGHIERMDERELTVDMQK